MKRIDHAIPQWRPLVAVIKAPAQFLVSFHIGQTVRAELYSRNSISRMQVYWTSSFLIYNGAPKNAAFDLIQLNVACFSFFPPSPASYVLAYV